MKVGDIQSEVCNRRNQVHHLVEMEEINQKNNEQPNEQINEQINEQTNEQTNEQINEKINELFITEDLLKKSIKQPQQEPVGCLARIFKCFRFKKQQKQVEYQPTELKDHYNLYDENWFDIQRNIIQQQQETSTPVGRKEIIHIVSQDDTIEGLELQYGVSACNIRTFNNLQTNDIFYLKKLIIPNPINNYQKQEIDIEKYIQDLKIVLFLDQICQPEDKNRKVALFYLDMNNWNYQKAAQEYLDDYKFELEQKKNQITSSLKVQE
ncbi:unnamed protein product [Paramecium sonneborni]|uniref:LysM domain-containing protein n=1 Tax=Paramecium sonneborni TaxID=65129 RepID=A0A8S1MS68_9CILI|nr:unnamed protein product [Paramecium sonneborni]